MLHVDQAITLLVACHHMGVMVMEGARGWVESGRELPNVSMCEDFQDVNGPSSECVPLDQAGAIHRALLGILQACCCLYNQLRCHWLVSCVTPAPRACSAGSPGLHHCL